VLGVSSKENHVTWMSPTIVVMGTVSLHLTTEKLISNVAPQQQPPQLQLLPPQRLPTLPLLGVSSKENHVTWMSRTIVVMGIVSLHLTTEKSISNVDPKQLQLQPLPQKTVKLMEMLALKMMQ